MQRVLHGAVPVLCVVAVLVGCGSADPAVQSDSASTIAPNEVHAGGVEAEFLSFEAPADLVEAADLVIAVRPADGQPASLRGERSLPTPNVVDEFWGRTFIVEEVLAGEGVEVGAELVVAWQQPRVTITISGTEEEHETLGGEGFLTDIEAEFAILGLTSGWVESDETEWGVIAGIQGLVAFEDVDGTWRVAETAPGSDGYLQQTLAGLTYEEVRAQFLEATPDAATGGPG